MNERGCTQRQRPKREVSKIVQMVCSKTGVAGIENDLNTEYEELLIIGE